MNQPPVNGELQFVLIPFPRGIELCWAGPNVVDPDTGLCFGTTDGKLLFADIEGRPLMVPGKGIREPGTGSVSREAINGVARVGTWVGVSTREEVNFWPLEGTPGGHKYGVVAPYGAHGITATAHGYFLAALGPNGIMAVQPPFDGAARVKAYSAEDAGLYVYRLTTLRSPTGAEVLVCATRLGGIAAGEFAAGQDTFNLKTGRFPGLDVVDICPLDPGADSRAVAALGRDASLILFEDVLGNTKSVTMKFRNVRGVAYRILSSHGDIHVLTSKGLYVLGELAGRFLRKELASGTTTPVRVSPMEAVDANLVYDRWLLVVMPGAVARFDLGAIHQEVLEHLHDAEIQESQPGDTSTALEWGNIQTTGKELALAG